MNKLQAILQIIWDSWLKAIVSVLLYGYYLWPNAPGSSYAVWTVLVYLLVGISCLTQWKKLLYVATLDPALMALLGFAAFSVFWSTTPGFTVSAVRTLLLGHLVGAYLAMQYDLRQQTKLLAWTLGIAAILSLVLTLALPSYGTAGGSFEAEWVGVFRHKNRLANAMVMTVLVFLNLHFYSRSFRKIALPIAFLAFILLVLSSGKGALTALIISLILLPLYRIIKHNDRRTKVFFFLVGAYGVGSIAFTLLANLNYIAVDLLGKDLTLTGRTDLWGYLISRGMQHPWLGYGYGGFWKDTKEALGVYLHNGWFTAALGGGGNAHSGYVELFLQLGWVGCLLLALSFVSVFWRTGQLISLTKGYEFFWALQFLFLLVLLNLSETNEAFLGARNIGWLFYTSISLSGLLQLKRLKKAQTTGTSYYPWNQNLVHKPSS